MRLTYVFLIMMCAALAGCGTKPTDEKSEKSEGKENAKEVGKPKGKDKADEVGKAGKENPFPAVSGEPIKATDGAVGKVRVGHIDVTVVPVDQTSFTSFAVWCATSDGNQGTQFRPWTNTRKDIPPLEDELGNKYPAEDDRLALPQWYFNKESKNPRWRELAVTFPSFSDGSGEITRAHAKCDVIIYRSVAPKAQTIKMRLPTENFGGSGTLVFEFEAAKVKEYAEKSDK